MEKPLSIFFFRYQALLKAESQRCEVPDSCTAAVLFSLIQKVRQNKPLSAVETGFSVLTYWLFKCCQCKRNTVKDEFAIFVSYWTQQHFRRREELFLQLWRQTAQLIAWLVAELFTPLSFPCLGAEIQSWIYQLVKLRISVLSQTAALKQNTVRKQSLLQISASSSPLR